MYQYNSMKKDALDKIKEERMPQIDIMKWGMPQTFKEMGYVSNKLNETRMLQINSMKRVCPSKPNKKGSALDKPKKRAYALDKLNKVGMHQKKFNEGGMPQYAMQSKENALDKLNEGGMP